MGGKGVRDRVALGFVIERGRVAIVGKKSGLDLDA
jgi:hypothetical protein